MPHSLFPSYEGRDDPGGASQGSSLQRGRRTNDLQKARQSGQRHSSTSRYESTLTNVKTAIYEEDSMSSDSPARAQFGTAKLLEDEVLHPLLAEDDDAADVRYEKRFDPHVVWQTTLSELALQMPSATYDTWVRDTWVVGYEDGEFIIGMPNAYARDWLENQLRGTIKRMLGSLIGRSVQVNFRVYPRPNPEQESEPPRAAPLFEWTSEAPTQPTPIPPDGLSGAGDNAPARAPEIMAARNDHDHHTSHINTQHTFESFIVGNHNRLAHAAAEAVADDPGQSFNPLFIYGGVGLGKTHLLHAIGNRVRAKGLEMLYCSSEQFTNELIASIRNQSTEAFRNKYRPVDILLIDDIQFIGGKESTQEEFFHTFNHLHAAGRQVVLSSDRPPKALATLEERLRSRFEGGLQTDISQPDFETRVAILQSKAARMGFPIHLDVLMLVAERVDSNIRELEGTLNRLVLQARLFSNSLDLQLAESILNNLAPQRTPRSPSIVIGIVAEHFRLLPEDLTGRVRTKEIARARQIVMYLLREENTLSLPMIGDKLGGRDHSTVRYGVEKIANESAVDEALRREIMILSEKLYTAPGA